MYYFSKDMVHAISESGAKNNLSRSIANFTGEDLWSLPGALEMKELYENYHMADDGRIRIDMSLHAEYTSNPNTVAALSKYTQEIGANMHVHVSETQEEHQACKERHGKTPASYLRDLGLFETPTTAAHCVWVEEGDMAILKEKGVTVAVNPISNLKLASGVCNVPALLEKGINVTIGTDSVASNNSLNFLEEMKVFALASKMQFNDPTKVTPKETLFAATRAGALAQGRKDTGLLEEGYLADLVVLDISGVHMKPIHNLLNNLVYSSSGSDVVLTMVDGKVLYREGTFPTIDMEKVVYETEKSVTRILSEI
jgi:5-methylthioadenosine/S-adenosylhomocysteine deaminase